MRQPGVRDPWRGRRNGKLWLSLLAALGAAGASCVGKIGGSGGDGTPPGTAMVTVGPTGLHRLSRIEYDNTLADLLGDGSRSGFAALPEDVNDPFDNDFSTQLVSGALIASAETLAAGAATRALADPGKRAALVGCAPSGPADRTCLESFVRAFGRRAFRRPLTEDEVSGYLGLQPFAVEAGDFYTGVQLILQGMLQDPSFLYRVEVGEAVAGAPGLYRLVDYE